MYFIRNRVYIYCYQHRHHSRLINQCSNTFNLVISAVVNLAYIWYLVQTCSNIFNECLNVGGPSCVVCLNTVWKVFGLLSMHALLFKQCVNTSVGNTSCLVCCSSTVQTSQHAHAAVWTLHAAVFRHVIHSFPCVWTVFKQPAMQWCAVQTLFEHHALLCMLSEHGSNTWKWV